MAKKYIYIKIKEETNKQTIKTIIYGIALYFHWKKFVFYHKADTKPNVCTLLLYQYMLHTPNPMHVTIILH